jgi:hypothetical protein
MAVTRPRRPILTNAEGIEIRPPRSTVNAFKDRVLFILVGLMQLIAVAIIIKQLKTLGLLPEWVDTDVKAVRSTKLC